MSVVAAAGADGGRPVFELRLPPFEVTKASCRGACVAGSAVVRPHQAGSRDATTVMRAIRAVNGLCGYRGIAWPCNMLYEHHASRAEPPIVAPRQRALLAAAAPHLFKARDDSAASRSRTDEQGRARVGVERYPYCRGWWAAERRSIRASRKTKAYAVPCRGAENRE